MTARTVLRRMLAEGETFCAPGVYDGLSAHLVEKAGFKAAYMTGAGTAASLIGKPDLGLTTLTEMAGHVGRLASAIDIPLIADADTGYGNALHVYRTIKEYERAGAAALHLEDQVFPKRCGHLAGKQVIPAGEFVAKIHAAVDARTDSEMVLIARTDARAPLGFDEAIERANRYAEAGADVIFVEAPQTIEEIERIPKEVSAPTMFNLVGGGRTPPVDIGRLGELGYSFVIAPGICMDAAVVAIRESLGRLLDTGELPESRGMSPERLFSIVGLDFWTDLSDRYAGQDTR
ncbi:MAG: carboxyvinyl-carboxyphosphonate phosphorylmutase [Streptosporangiales bacterium]|nr:carboxyvinyl-carboxyphosphonate phosphorylmutase [Streptosporangiales bacterium]